jgi:hypothetical protein
MQDRGQRVQWDHSPITQLRVGAIVGKYVGCVVGKYVAEVGPCVGSDVGDAVGEIVATQNADATGLRPCSHAHPNTALHRHNATLDIRLLMHGDHAPAFHWP